MKMVTKKNLKFETIFKINDKRQLFKLSFYKYEIYDKNYFMN